MVCLCGNERVFDWYRVRCRTCTESTPIIQGIETLLGKNCLSDGIYFVDFLPSELHWFDVVLVLVAALVLSLVASLYPFSVERSYNRPRKVLRSNHY